MIVVDYTCGHCRGCFELYVRAPVPKTSRCAACGEQASRSFRTAGLVGGGSASTPADSGAAPLCARNPDIPLLCHADRETQKSILDAAGRRVD